MVDRTLIIKVVVGVAVLGAAATAYLECGGSSDDSGPGLYQHRKINRPPGMLPHGPSGAGTAKSPNDSKSANDSKSQGDSH